MRVKAERRWRRLGMFRKRKREGVPAYREMGLDEEQRQQQKTRGGVRRGKIRGRGRESEVDDLSGEADFRVSLLFTARVRRGSCGVW